MPRRRTARPPRPRASARSSRRPRTSRPPPGAPRRRAPEWTRLSNEELLDVPLRRLGLRIEGTALETRIEQLYAEMRQTGFRFRPYVWLSTDWFTPDGLTGFAVPFYLAHPRLARLEQSQMFEVEGGTRDACMKLLRHEAAHALDNAYRLHRRKRWRNTFGRFTEPYRATYVPRPKSRRYVLNLDYWYSQSHPVEDYAETFAVWLQPGTRWRRRYGGWPALRKLEFVDQLMREIAGRPPAVRTRKRVESLPALRLTLRQYYRRKKALYREPGSRDYDDPLHRVFSPERHGRSESAARFLLRSRPHLRRRVSALTGQHQYVIDQVLNEMVPRCRVLGLRLRRPPGETLVDVAVLLTSLTMSFLYGSHPEYRR